MRGRKILGQDIERVETIIKKFIPSCLVNIVEEPEKNLFAATQGDVLYKLLEYKTISKNNKHHLIAAAEVDEYSININDTFDTLLGKLKLKMSNDVAGF